MLSELNKLFKLIWQKKKNTHSVVLRAMPAGAYLKLILTVWDFSHHSWFKC